MRPIRKAIIGRAFRTRIFPDWPVSSVNSPCRRALHVHFNGAGGNIGAGKYNDGAPENRLLLAQRLSDGMRRAWENTKREPITATNVSWATKAVSLPPAKHLALDEFEKQLKSGTPAFVATGGP